VRKQLEPGLAQADADVRFEGTDREGQRDEQGHPQLRDTRRDGGAHGVHGVLAGIHSSATASISLVDSSCMAAPYAPPEARKTVGAGPHERSRNARARSADRAGGSVAPSGGTGWKAEVEERRAELVRQLDGSRAPDAAAANRSRYDLTQQD